VIKIVTDSNLIIKYKKLQVTSLWSRKVKKIEKKNIWYYYYIYFFKMFNQSPVAPAFAFAFAFDQSDYNLNEQELDFLSILLFLLFP
jgi:hypothetical protein